jgi:hypothetical protein
MCRNAKFCTELGTDPSRWSTRAPLMHPDWFQESLRSFIDAYKFAKKRQITDALRFLEKTRSDELRYWFIEHGQMSGWYHRAKILNLPKESKPQTNELRRESFAPIAREIYTRDGYVCRYCSTRVIDIKALKRMEKLLGREKFQATGRTNETRHGIALVFRATIDHVVPVSLGGETNLDNLVTACWSCNYGKAGESIKRIGLADPRCCSSEEQSEWSGLIEIY